MRRAGHTVIELIIVISVMAILAAVAYPALRDTGLFRLDAAARRLAADIHFVKNRAMATHAVCGVAFDASGDRYALFTGDPSAPLEHPLRPGEPYRVDLGAEGVDVVAAVFGGGDELRFDPLGQPLDGTGQPFHAAGRVVLACGSGLDTVRVDAFTGGVDGP